MNEFNAKCVSMDRRTFLGGLSATVLASCQSKLMGHDHLSGNSSDFRPTLGVIGLGQQGRFLARRFSEMATVKLVCDVHAGRRQTVLAGASHLAESADYRELLEDEALDAVVIATPDHWHAKMTVDALRAKKHVYLEPPVCRTLSECRDMLRAEEESRKVLQVAIMGRANAAAAAVARHRITGKLGDVGGIALWSEYGPKPVNCLVGEVVPNGLDWRGWLGPTRERPYCRELLDEESIEFEAGV